mmetsp:Transcript_12369/g.34288  ORF Transcript_12369/g.34288 Transcript_12369/m.34288 type:complete len:528 (-) Transcript_12369:1191-2774(-)
MSQSPSTAAHDASSFQDTSEDCAICLCPLEDDDENEVIALGCGHRWHLACIKQQLEHGKPSHAKRLLFNGCQCAKCGSFCDHPKLEHMTRPTDDLREKVDELIVEQLRVDAPAGWRRNGSDRTALMDQGRRKYAFFLCSNCNEPYFGGTVECADQQEGELAPNDQLCVACSPQPQIVCQNPLQHRGHMTWKCRYCCRPSTFLCYGSVHFCDACHERNSHRVQQQQRIGRNSSNAPPLLEPIPCPGDSCTFPKPAGKTKHNNGTTSDCEQVYHCACCQSSDSQRSAANVQEPGSANLLVNTSGERGLALWQQLNRRSSWKVEQSAIPSGENVSTNFVSSYQWCVMAQRVDLQSLLRNPSLARVEASAKYMGRTDCPSVFRLEVIILDRSQRIIQRQSTPTLDAPPDYWERARLIVEPLENMSEIVLVVHGKDSRFWQGDFGSKVSECSIRILGGEEELNRQFLNRPQQSNGGGPQVGFPVGATATTIGEENRRLPERRQPPVAAEANRLYLDAILPLIFFLVLFWLAS